MDEEKRKKEKGMYYIPFEGTLLLYFLSEQSCREYY